MLNLLEYAGKRITVTFLDEGENKTITGQVIKANAMCIMVRPKGKPYILVDVESVASIRETDEPVKAPSIKVRSMDKVLPANVRQHLADRHGVAIHLIPNSEAEAVKMHDNWGHGTLGHHHRPDVGEVAERATVLDCVLKPSVPDNSLRAPVEDEASAEDETPPVEGGRPPCNFLHPGVVCDDEDCPCNCRYCGDEYEVIVVV